MSEWRLTLFRDDDETPLRGTVNPDGSVAEATCTTQAGQPFPYLMAPDAFAESEVDLAEGHSVIGQVNVRVLDVRTGADQATGWLTALLSADGYSALNGRRALVEQRDAASATWFLLMDGIVGGVSLQDDYVTYALELRDVRERERKVKAFVNSDTSTIFPRGVLGGYGRQQVHVKTEVGDELKHFTRWLIAPTVPVRGVYHAKENTWGVVDLRGLWRGKRVPPYLVVTKKMRDVLKPESRVVSTDRQAFFRRYELTYPQARILWRRQGTQQWTEIRAPQRVAWNKKGMIETGRAYTEDDGPSLRAAKTLTLGSIDPAELPQNGWAVEVVIGYNGPPSEEYPLHLEGMTAGELLRDLYDGRYSPGQPDLGVRYDGEALLKLDTPVRARLTEPVDDLRQWVEENVYRPLGAAPALDERGRISPIRYALPTGVDPDDLLELNDENTAPDAAWEHTAGAAVNHVVVTYARDYRVEEEDDPEGEVGRGDGLAEMETTIEHVNIDSMALLGEKKLELELKLFRAVGGDDGSPVGGDVSDDTGFLLAQERAAQALDRFVFGAQSITAKCTRSSTHALRVGDWVIAGMSWLPDYGSGRRGTNRLAQVVSIKDLDPAWREVRLVDAGPRMQPVPMPALVVLLPDDTGAIPVQVLGIAPGTEAVVEFAVVSFDALGAPLPTGAESAEWVPAGRVGPPPAAGDSLPVVHTPPLPAGATVRIRARGVAPGRLSSAHTGVLTVRVPATPRVLSLRVEVPAETRVPVVRWQANLLAPGVRLRWSVQAPGGAADPSASPVYRDARGDAGTLTLPVTLQPGQEVTVSAQPWSGWDVSVVSGTPGTPVLASATLAADASSLALNNFREVARTHTHITYAWQRGVQVAEVWVYDRQRDEPSAVAPWPDAAEIPDLVLVTDDTYTVELPSAGRLGFLQVEPRSGALAAGAARRILIHPAPVALAAALRATVNGDTADLELRVKASPSAYPLQVELHEDSADGAPFATRTFVMDTAHPAAEQVLGPAGEPALGGRALPLREVRRWFARVTDVAGNLAWAFAAADRDALPSATVTPEDYLARPALACFFDDDTDLVEVTTPSGTLTWPRADGRSSFVYRVGDALDTGFAEAPFRVDEERAYRVRVRGGDTWVVVYSGPLHGVSSHPPTVRPRMVYTAQHDRADVFLTAESPVGEAMELWMKDSEAADAPEHVLVDGNGVRHVPSGGAEVAPGSLWSAGGTGTAVALLSAVELKREQIRRFFFRARGVDSGVEGAWTALTLSAQRFPWLESVDLVWDETANVLRLTAVGGAFCATGTFQLAQDSAFAVLAHEESRLTLVEGEPRAVTFAPPAEARNRVWYARVLPFNDAELEGKAQQDTAFVPAEVRVVGISGEENAAGTGATLKVTVEDPGNRLARGVFYVSRGREPRRAATTVGAVVVSPGRKELTLVFALHAEHVTLVEPTLELVDNRVIGLPAQTFDTDKVPRVMDLLVTPDGALARIEAVGDSDCEALHLEESLDGALWSGAQSRTGSRTALGSPFVVTQDPQQRKLVRVWGTNEAHTGEYRFARVEPASAEVTWQIEVSEELEATPPQGKLTLTLADRGGRVRDVAFTTQKGREDKQGGTAATPVDGVYTARVELDTTSTSTIEPVIRLWDNTVLRPGSETFDLAPVANVVSVDVSYGGTAATVHVAFDSDTASGWYREVTDGVTDVPHQVTLDGRRGSISLTADPESARRYEVYGHDAGGRPGPAATFAISPVVDNGQPQLVIEVGESLSSGGVKQGWCTVRADRGEERIQGVEFFRQSGGGPRESATVTFSDHRWRAEVNLDPKHISSIEPVVHLTDGSVIQPGPQAYDIDDTANVLGVVVSPDGQGTAVVRVRADTDTTAVEWRETGPAHESDAWIAGEPDETDHTWLLPETAAGLPALTQGETLRTCVVRGLNEGDPGPSWVFDVPSYVAPPAAAAVINAAAFGSADGACPYMSVINSISWDVSGVDAVDHFVEVERVSHASPDAVPTAGEDAWVNHNYNQNATYTVTAAERALTGSLSDRFPGSVREGVGFDPYFSYFVVVYHRDSATTRTEVARKLAGTVETGVSYCEASTGTPRYGGGITRIAPEV